MLKVYYSHISPSCTVPYKTVQMSLQGSCGVNMTLVSPLTCAYSIMGNARSACNDNNMEIRISKSDKAKLAAWCPIHHCNSYRIQCLLLTGIHTCTYRFVILSFVSGGQEEPVTFRYFNHWRYKVWSAIELSDCLPSWLFTVFPGSEHSSNPYSITHLSHM